MYFQHFTTKQIRVSRICHSNQLKTKRNLLNLVKVLKNKTAIRWRNLNVASLFSAFKIHSERIRKVKKSSQQLQIIMAYNLTTLKQSKQTNAIEVIAPQANAKSKFLRKTFPKLFSEFQARKYNKHTLRTKGASKLIITLILVWFPLGVIHLLI